MTADPDSRLTGLAVQTLREALRTHRTSDLGAELAGYLPLAAGWNSVMFGGSETGGLARGSTGSFHALTGSLQPLTGSLASLTGSLPALTGAIPVLTGSFQALGQPNGFTEQDTMRELLRLPPELPGVLLPADEDLAAAARSAPIMVHLAALARWLGEGGRPVTGDDQLASEQAAEAAGALGVAPDYLRSLWAYGLASGWIMLADAVAGDRTWAVPGATDFRWAGGDARGVLHVWAAVYAAVLAVTLELTSGQAPEDKRLGRVQGQGVVLAVVMFLARRTGLTVADAADVIRIGAIGEAPPRRVRKAWAERASQSGEPGRRLLAELAALRAVEMPGAGEGAVTLTPLAQWALREQFVFDGIKVPVARVAAQLSAADLVSIVAGVSELDFDAQFQRWLTGRGPGRGAQELLLFAGSASPAGRIAAVGLARRIGPSAVPAWLDAMQRRELRGYARIALSVLAADLPEASLPLMLNPAPDDLDGMAGDLVSLIGDDDIPDPDRIEALFAEVVPKGEEEWIIGLLASGGHRDVIRLLELLSHCYSDRRLARSARKAAHAAAKNGVADAPAGVSVREGRR